MFPLFTWRAAVAALFLHPLAHPVSAALLDRLDLGVSASEQAHNLLPKLSEIIPGGLGQPARRLLPQQPHSWEGGEISFVVKVHPEQQTYLTVRLWGDDVLQQSHVLFVDGKQIGYRHLGDVELLDHGAEEPGYNGRFYYRTCPLPVACTKGKSSVHCTIRLNGRLWGYGENFEEYQKPCTEPGRGLYAIYTHTDGYLEPPADEKQGTAPTVPPNPSELGAEVMQTLTNRVNKELQKALHERRPHGQLGAQFLAKAYHLQKNPAYHNPAAVDQVIRSVDDLWKRHSTDASLLKGDPGVHNKEWFSYGLAADAVRLLVEPLRPRLAETIDNGQGLKLPRKSAWGQMFLAGREFLRQHRRQYTNQSMIIDMNMYRQNKALVLCAPNDALPEPRALRYLHESVGLEPWLGSETPSGPAKPLGDHFYQLTRKGLTRELGYVGGYGEVLDWVVQIYEATQPPGGKGDAKIASQLAKMVRARGYFRYPMHDAAGRPAMRLQTVVGWRDVHFPGDITYLGRHSWDATSLCSTLATQDPWTIGFAQQALAEGQFYPSLTQHLQEKGYRTTIGLLGADEQLATLQTQPQSPQRLPMSPGQPDFAWADEENGVVAVKNGPDILYASLYWRARSAVNFLAKIHLLTPTTSHIAVVKQDTQFTDSGLRWKRPNWTNFGFANGGLRYPQQEPSAHHGEELPIAQGPPSADYKAGKETLYAGRGEFYQMHYGPWFIAMNTTETKTFPLTTPPATPNAATTAKDLVSGKTLNLAAPIQLPPLTTVVLRF